MVKKIIALFIFALVVVAAAYGVSRMERSPQDDKARENTNSAKTSEPVLEKVNVGAAVNPEAKLPDGFPKDVPVDLSQIVSAYSATYPGRPMTQYTVSYLSSKSRSEKYQDYLSFMTAAGYDFGPSGKNPGAFSLYGAKDNDDLSVSVSTERGKTLVQISYLDRE